MLNKKQIIGLTDQLGTMKLLVQTYEEVAAMHMRKIRNNVIASRGFIDELEAIYQELKVSYQDQIAKLLAKKQKTTHILSEKNGKSVTVFLSANTRLYGEIVQETFASFVDFIDTHETDIVVVGKLGENLMQETKPGRKFVTADVPDTNITPQVLASLLTKLLEYEKIFVFYGRFQTIASQKPYMLDVYGQTDSNKNLTKHVQYLFEPSLEKILQFFEQQIFSSVIEQSFRESELAKFAARMIALDSATDNIALQMKKVDLQRRILKHHIDNQKQLQTTSSLSEWTLQ